MLHRGPVEVPLCPRLDSSLHWPPTLHGRWARGQLLLSCGQYSRNSAESWTTGRLLWPWCIFPVSLAVLGFPAVFPERMSSYKILLVLNDSWESNTQEENADTPLTCLAHYLTQASNPFCLRHCKMEPLTFYCLQHVSCCWFNILEVICASDSNRLVQAFGTCPLIVISSPKWNPKMKTFHVLLDLDYREMRIKMF